MHPAILNFLPDSFEKIFPSIAPTIDGFSKSAFAVFLQNAFAPIEVFHLLGLFMIGGATILTCLRLIGVGLFDISTSEVEKNTRPWLILGVVMAIGTGLLIGLSNASKLYNNSAFLFKMVAMVAGIIFSFCVTIPAAKAEGAVRGGARVGLVVGLLIWLLALAIMIVKPGSNVGAFHLIWAGALIVFASMQGKLRWVFLAVAGGLMIVWQVYTHTVVHEGSPDSAEMLAYVGANRTFMWLSALTIGGFAAANILGTAAPKDSNALARLVGYVTILVWVTVGAGGRWIGLT